jgi:hypothetical protein
LVVTLGSLAIPILATIMAGTMAHPALAKSGSLHTSCTLCIEYVTMSYYRAPAEACRHRPARALQASGASSLPRTRTGRIVQGARRVTYLASDLCLVDEG